MVIFLKIIKLPPCQSHVDAFAVLNNMDTCITNAQCTHPILLSVQMC